VRHVAFIDHLVWIGRFKRAYTRVHGMARGRGATGGRGGGLAWVVVSSSAVVVLDVDGQGLEAEDEPELFVDAALARTLRQLGGRGGDVTLIGDTPTSDHDVPGSASPMRRARSSASRARRGARASAIRASHPRPCRG
jgi:hypothetical protein